MDSQEWKKKSGQIPAFGNWDLANDMPITQYFDCPRQAGLLRYSNSSSAETETDLYALHFHKPKTVHNSNKHKNQGTRNRERRCPVGGNGMVKEKEDVNVIITRKQGKVNDVVAEQPRKAIRVSKKLQVHQNDTVTRSPPRKPVDEDLYKISPDLLRTTKRKNMLGFISRCLVPAACIS